MILTQNYSNYTTENHTVWAILFERQYQNLQGKAIPEFFEGLEKVGFDRNHIPDFDEVNKRLKPLTGFEVVPAPGLVDDTLFFQLIAARKFPATVWIRSMAQLDYLEEPDMFHDVFGHVPLLTIPVYCQFLEQLSQLALQYTDRPDVIDLLTRIYWYTIEFGLFSKNGKAQIYGAGVLSSVGESNLAVSDASIKYRFDVEQVLNTTYIKETFQSQYFLITDFKELLDALPALSEALVALKESIEAPLEM
ncbi:phenylalanine 4-monooxygenase [Pontibacter sp. H259]|uniref:phenylalanine 4-monooxygenase n=1 Tax=Pontibacter sp. H259 TaxID=3133421 RepID=UPI0030BD1CE6